MERVAVIVVLGLLVLAGLVAWLEQGVIALGLVLACLLIVCGFLTRRWPPPDKTPNPEPPRILRFHDRAKDPGSDEGYPRVAR